MFAHKLRTERIIRITLIAMILLNAFMPTAGLASSAKEDAKSPDSTKTNAPRTLPEQKPQYFAPPLIHDPVRKPPEPDQPPSPIPPKDPIEFSLVAGPSVVPSNGLVKFNVDIRNNSDQKVQGLSFSDPLEAGLEYASDSSSRFV